MEEEEKVRQAAGNSKRSPRDRGMMELVFLACEQLSEKAGGHWLHKTRSHPAPMVPDAVAKVKLEASRAEEKMQAASEELAAQGERGSKGVTFEGLGVQGSPESVVGKSHFLFKTLGVGDTRTLGVGDAHTRAVRGLRVAIRSPEHDIGP